MNTLPTSIKNPVTEVIYQRPTLQQTETLRIFFQRSLEKNFYYFPKAAHAQYAKSWQKEILDARIRANNDLLLCAWVKNKLAGLVSGTAVEGGVGSIIWLTIDPEFQNNKIGSQLLTRAKNHYQNLGAHKLKLTVQDKRAASFYEREGLIVECMHQNHWWNLDFWAMACFLS